ncbi:uncharacterized protein RJT20DRAFT_130815 [Scheffersomyces xylosifermentans]|uniref:uncharacterized protein n=1 Tax=Scheffersomyces xylosifermentans TaxID=1304137 RepID=UPI00315D9316
MIKLFISLTMSSTNIISVHSVTLLNISDHVTRQSNTNFGVLVGRVTDGNCVVHTSFELLFEKDNTTIDMHYLYKRFVQFKTVLPQYTIVGLYHIRDNLAPDDTTLDAMTQLQGINDALKKYANSGEESSTSFYVIVNPKDFREVHDKQVDALPLQGYLFPENWTVTTVISSNESENIATYTVANNKDYFSTEKSKDVTSNEITTAQSNKEIAVSINHLQEKLVKILQYVEYVTTSESIPHVDIERTIELNNLVVHLANRLEAFKDGAIREDLSEKLQSSQLGLLTEQIIALDTLRKQIARSIVSYGINTSGPPKADASFLWPHHK